MRNFIPFLLMMAEGEGGTGTGGAMVDVDLPGNVSVKLPRDQADKVIAGRQASKAELADLNTRYGALSAEKTAAETKATEAQRAREHAEAVKNGEVDKAREIASKAGNEKLAKLGNRARDREIEALVRSVAGVVPEAVADIVAQLKGSCNFNLDLETLEVMDAGGKPRLGDDGKPMGADAYIADFLKDRPYFRTGSAASGSGAAGSGKGAAAGATMTAADLERMAPRERAVFFQNGGKQVG